MNNKPLHVTESEVRRWMKMSDEEYEKLVKPFIAMVDGKIVRSSLEDFLRSRRVPEEI